MEWLERVKFKFRKFGIPNLMTYVTIAMLILYLSQNLLGIPIIHWLSFNRHLIMRGQIWRLITFIFVPPNSSFFWILITLYAYYFVGSNLEREWGTSTFTLYYLVGMIGTILSGLLTVTTTNTYLNLSLFLAFAQLFPDVEFLVFYFLPIKAKYLGYASLILNGMSLIFSILNRNWPEVLALIAAFLNFLLFFGPQFIRTIKHKIKFRNWNK